MNTITNTKTNWVDIEKPSSNDINYLRDNFKFHGAVLNELIPDTIRTKVDSYDDYFYIVLHFPTFDKKTRTGRSQELDILITKDTLITSHKEIIIPLKAFFDKCNLYPEEKEKLLASGPAKLLYLIIDDLLNSCTLHLDDISQAIDKIENAIFHGKEKEMIKEISIIKRNVLDFRRALKPQKQILESLYTAINKYFGDEYLPFFNDLVGHHLRLWDILDSYKELLESLESTNTTLFGARLNETMKILTIFTALLLPISIMSGLFGMNVSVPLQDHPQGFYIIIAILISAFLALYLLFKRKKII